ncbi:cholesterol oxidase precursor [Metarhizium album ARSEF 1941]|uniref:Cholesterol oxidase n=1 Tax=Metarhizium album (strain ARSEF 1941) TaxID=1081103 RepID=A0A0B2WQP8_METAS|nr:cholesterol oxidase precursor [Metarhizium album ARSEF 1941]KHN98386.1 cholesterol oxidase precursor [Metarhizium album ARSEF 1941]
MYTDTYTTKAGRCGPGRAQGNGASGAKARRRFPRISQPVELIQGSYDCVVVGSGYGGGVAASRMARTGQSVCVLERGQERWPGEYPVCLKQVFGELHTTGRSMVRPFGRGRPTGMYHVVAGQGQSALVCNGLGGTSLINANVFLEADESTLSMETWPPEIRRDPGCLKEYYQRVRDVLEPTPYPDDWPRLSKVEVFKRQAHMMGLGGRYYKVPQTTRFQPGINSCGVNMLPSTLTGQDTTGVNDGSKTTTLVTYLADAWNWGAEIFCQCEVRHVEKVADGRGGYIVYFAWHGHKRARFKRRLHEDLLWVHAKHAVFLGAGSLGTTEILLRSKDMGLSMSDCLGQGMSGNGDMLTFGYNTNRHVNAMGRQRPDRKSPVGPTINATIDMRGLSDNPLDGFVIQEGAVPQALARLMQTIVDVQPSGSKPKRAVVQRARKALARWKSRLLGPYVCGGAIQNTQIFLIMSHDGSQATLRLENDKPVLEFVGVGHSDRVKRLHAVLAKATEAVGGRVVDNPFHGVFGDQHQITAHPLGGAPMSRDGTGARGVTNHVGQVFAGSATSESHAGLIVVDAAVVPGSLCVNPAATIAALAERAVDHYIRARGLVMSKEPNGVLDLYGTPAHRPPSTSSDKSRHTKPDSASRKTQTGPAARCTVRGVDHEPHGSPGTVGFTELMSGFVHGGNNLQSYDRDSHKLSSQAARRRGETARLLTSNVMYAVRKPGSANKTGLYKGIVKGTFICPTIRGSPFMISQGEAELLEEDEEQSGTTKVTYRLKMIGIDGRRLDFHGYKRIDSSVSMNMREMWRSTTTLYVTITESVGQGHSHETNSGLHNKSPALGDAKRRQSSTRGDGDGEARTIAKGILKIRLSDFWKQLFTLTATGDSLTKRVATLGCLTNYFSGKLLPRFFLPFAPLRYATKSHPDFVNPTTPTRTYTVTASDGVQTKLHMWEPDLSCVPGDEFGNPVPVKNLFMIPGASVDHRIYALPTIPINAVNYFTRAGYRVFVTVHRIGIVDGPEDKTWTTYDARLDIRACLQHIRASQNTHKVYTVAHCMGSVAFACGLLDGTIPADWILGITCSQVFMNPVWSKSNRFKSTVKLDRAYTRLAGHWFSCRASAKHGALQSAVDQMLRFLPDKKGEKCNSASCHRISLLFGRCWSHYNLNEATHRHVDHFFNGANMTLMPLLMRMGRVEAVSTNGPAHQDLTSAENVERLRGIPFFLFSGGDSDVLSPTATQKTYERLCDTFGISAGRPGGGIQYRRKVIPGYGHLDGWMGRNAYKDVYPLVREEVDRVVRGEEYKLRDTTNPFSDAYGVA